MLELLIAAMLTIAGAEIHDLDTDARQHYRDGVAELARINVEVGAEGWLINAEADPVLLTTIQWYEARFRPDVPDGDCRMVGLGPETRRICSATGPMQLVKVAGQLPLFKGTAFEAMTAQQLRNPDTNIRAAYLALRFYKQLCGGKPGVWITAYGFGRCPRRSWRDYGPLHWEGARRCALLTELLHATGSTPPRWRCGHEGQSVLPHTRYLVRRLHAATLARESSQ